MDTRTIKTIFLFHYFADNMKLMSSKKIQTLLVVLGVGLLSIATMIGILSSTTESSFEMYGVATITHHDKDGKLVSTQTIHNRLLDAGEAYMLNQTFRGLGASDVADATQIGAICLSTGSDTITEGYDINTFNTNHEGADNDAATSSTNCKTDTSITATDGVAIIGPLTFQSENNDSGNWYAGDDVTHIGVCVATSDGTDIRGCQEILFAAVDTEPNITLQDGETVTVTYNFDMSSDDN